MQVKARTDTDGNELHGKYYACTKCSKTIGVLWVLEGGKSSRFEILYCKHCEESVKVKQADAM